MSRPIDEIPKASRWPMKIGLTLTVVWVACIIALVLYFSPENWQEFKLNELGDFIAGVSAPLAFLWLVVGIWQQGEDLKLQRADLQHGMKMTREIADTAKAEHELAIGEAQPRFVNCTLRNANLPNHFNIESSNVGNVAHDVKVLEHNSTSEIDMAFKLPISIDKTRRTILKFVSNPIGKSGWIKFGYLDRNQADQFLWAYLTDESRLYFRDHGDPPLDDESELQQWISETH